MLMDAIEKRPSINKALIQAAGQRLLLEPVQEIHAQVHTGNALSLQDKVNRHSLLYPTYWVLLF